MHSQPSGEAENFRQALRPLRRLYGNTLVEKFGPKALKGLRFEMNRMGWARTYINRQIDRIKQVFKWGVAEELLPPSIYHGLLAVAGLRKGEADTRESEPVKPVPIDYVNGILAHVSRPAKSMIEIQLLTGMRPGEICMMRSCNIDTTGKLWLYTPTKHKTEHHGHTRQIYLGPKAQEIIRPFLKMDTKSYLFSPAEAERERREQLHAARKTPMNQGNKPGSNRARQRDRAPGEHYDEASYRRAISRGCQKAFSMPADLAKAPKDETPEHKKTRLASARKWRADHIWHPNQLRHTAATDLRKTYGLEAAQVILGHKTLSVTQIYAEKNVEAAQRIMAAVG